MKITTLRKRAFFWQERLRLQDWRVEYYFAQPGEMSNDSLRGECEAELANKTAVIHVAHPKWSDSVENDIDVEIALVHEILHLLGWGLEPKEKTKADLFEYFIEVVAEALVKQLGKNSRRKVTK